MQKTVRKILRAVADYDPDYYDMYADDNEASFARLYVERIARHAEAAGILPPATEPGHPAKVLWRGGRGSAGAAGGGATEPGAPRCARGGDGSAGVGGRPRPRLVEAGCQAGRLVVPLAKLGFQVTGIDTSGFALRRANAHARTARVEATFVRGDLLDVLSRDQRAQYDLAVCAEVVYLSPRYREMLHALARAVRPGGLVCVSHRPALYYVIEALRQGDVEAASSVLARSEGPFRDSAYYNWQTEEELRALYASVGLQWQAMYPIDSLAWLAGLNLKTLTQEQREAWLQCELRAAASAGPCARYVLVIARRPSEIRA